MPAILLFTKKYWKRCVKRIAAMLLAVFLILQCLSGCSAAGGDQEAEEIEIEGITYKKAAGLSEEPVELTYLTTENSASTRYLADRFMELYPNIKINYTVKAEAVYDTELDNAIQQGKIPDILMYGESPDYLLERKLLLDITEYWEEDPETEELASTINDCEIGMYGTAHRYAVPFRFYPAAVFVNLPTLEQLGIAAPSRDWTWDEMTGIMQKASVKKKDSPDGAAYYGYEDRTYDFGDLYQVSAEQGAKGPSGYNGKTFDLTNWKNGTEDLVELYRQDGIAMGNLPDAEGVLQSALMSDHLAVRTGRFQDFQQDYNTEWTEGLNLDIIPYVVPCGTKEETKKEHPMLCTMDFAGISSHCGHPREAYEFLKFISYGRDGWKTRIQMYEDGTVRFEALPVRQWDMPVPLTKDKEIWDGYKEMFCRGMDGEHAGYWDDYFSRCGKPVPEGSSTTVGLYDYRLDYYQKLIVVKPSGKTMRRCDAMKNGMYPLEKYAEEGTRMMNWYHARRMLDYFGPDGYNVLSGKECREYESVLDGKGK